jgi:parallel beta-helix repeat protein
MGSVSAINTISIEAQSRGTILYVGGSGSGNYTKIQDAIDDASQGDTVYVYNDSSPYYENLVVDKSISLIGEDRNTTIIDGSGWWVIDVNTDNASISCFTIQNGYAVRIPPNSNYNIIRYNIITNNSNGIYIGESFHNTIRDNIIANNGQEGIVIYSGTKNIVLNNTIYNHTYGILMRSRANRIEDNLIYNNWWRGIELDDSSDNEILHNHIFNNGNPDEELDIGIDVFLDNSSENRIIGNLFSNSLDYCIFLSRKSNQNNISSNTILNCNRDGIAISTSVRNIVYGNSIMNCNYSGVHLFLTIGDRILNNNFYNNNSRHGLFVFSFLHRWDGNYWGEPRLLPYPIFGIFGIKFDWHPAQEPYELGGQV